MFYARVYMYREIFGFASLYVVCVMPAAIDGIAAHAQFLSKYVHYMLFLITARVGLPITHSLIHPGDIYSQ